MPFKNNESIGEHLIHTIAKEKRDTGLCEKCGSKNNLTVHHIERTKWKTYDLENFQILCYKCHKKIHEKEDSKKNGRFKKK